MQSSSSMHQYECIVLYKDINFQKSILSQFSGFMQLQIQAREIALVVYIQVIHGRPGGRLQLSGGGSEITWLASAFKSCVSVSFNFITVWNMFPYVAYCLSIVSQHWPLLLYHLFCHILFVYFSQLSVLDYDYTAHYKSCFSIILVSLTLLTPILTLLMITFPLRESHSTELYTSCHFHTSAIPHFRNSWKWRHWSY